MPSKNPKPNDYFSSSKHLYCLITDVKGTIQCSNQLANSHLLLTEAGSVLPLLEKATTKVGNEGISIYHTAVDNKEYKIEWEIFEFSATKKLYKWIAPVNKNIDFVTGNKENTVTTVSNPFDSLQTSTTTFAKSELFYSSLVANSLDGIILTDATGKITFVSPYIKTILGHEAEDATGLNAFSFVHPDDHIIAYDAFFKEVNATPEVKFIVIRLLKSNGDWLWCMVRGHNLLNNVNLQSIVIYFHDDTLRKEANDALKESEKRFRKLIRDLQIGVLLQDADGKISMLNKAILKILAVKEQDLIGKHFWEVFKDAIREDGRAFSSNERPLLNVLKTKGAIHDIVMGIYRPSTKDRVWVIVNVDPILDSEGKIIHTICSIADITERKKLEQKLLIDKINHQKLLTQATIDGQEKERKEIGKELHDNIGQQLTTIKLFLDLAKTTADDTTNEMLSLALKGVSDIINEVRRMSRALVPPTLGDLGLIDSVNDLIDSISRTQYLKIEFDYFGFNENFISDNKKLMIFRIIQEQLNNIVKHAEAKNVGISLIDEEAHLLLEIKDDGKGFDLKKTRKGLGLTNMKNRAELFEGKIDILTEPGHGCSLFVYLPTINEEVWQK